MALVKLKYHMGIERLAHGTQEALSFDGETLGELVLQLLEKHPSLKECFVRKEGLKAAPGISILVNGREIMWLQGMATRLSEGDEISMLRFVSGG